MAATLQSSTFPSWTVNLLLVCTESTQMQTIMGPSKEQPGISGCRGPSQSSPEAGGHTETQGACQAHINYSTKLWKVLDDLGPRGFNMFMLISWLHIRTFHRPLPRALKSEPQVSAGTCTLWKNMTMVRHSLAALTV